MARDAVSITALVLNSNVDTPTGTTITPANGAYVDCDGDTQGLIIEIDHTTVSGKLLTITTGDNPPAFEQGLGDFTVTMTASKVTKVILDSMRFTQNDGTILLDFASGTTGTIKCYRLPKSAR